ncbi:MAG: diguanylate cyclase domain-containing protein [Rubrivivax sp.]|jgi:diguanylate cyclase (GGDEF)-like protein
MAPPSTPEAYRLLDSVPYPLVLCTARTEGWCLVFANRPATHQFPHLADHVPGMDVADALGIGLSPEDRRAILDASACASGWTGKVRVHEASNSSSQRNRWVELSVSAVQAGVSGIDAAVDARTGPVSLWTLRDITPDIVQADALRWAQQQEAQTLAFAGIGRLNMALETGQVSLSERQAHLLELGRSALTADWDEVRERIDPDYLLAFDEAIDHAIRTGLSIDLETRMRPTQAASGARWLHWRGEVETAHNAPGTAPQAHPQLVLTLITQDVSSRREALETLSYRAHHDALTGLPNRLLLEDRLANAVRLAERERSCCAVLFVDLDGFKQVNDRFGHDAGDHVLRTVAQTLCDSVRRSDTVARLGGDEFVVLLPRVADLDHALQARDKIALQLNSQIDWGAHRLAIGASIGLSAYPDHGFEPAQLLSHADRDMYRTKAGRGGQAQAAA